MTKLVAQTLTDLLRRHRSRYITFRDVLRWALFGAAISALVAFAIVETSALDPLPSPPEIVSATAAADNTVFVNWSRSSETSGAALYRVWRSTDGDSYAPVAVVSGVGDVAAYIDTGRSSSTRYWYAVSTLDDRGESALSSTSTAVWDSIATTTGAPPRPGLPVSVLASGPVWFSWEAPADPAIVGYYVYRATSSRGAFTTITAAAIPRTNYLDTTAGPDTTYWYRVRAVNGSGVFGPLSVEYADRMENLGGFLSSPHGTSLSDDDECAACHRGHTGLGQKVMSSDPTSSVPASPAPDPVWATAVNQEACLFCHNGTVASDVKAQVETTQVASRHPIDAGDNDGTQYCGTCHVSHRVRDAVPNPSLITVGASTNGNDVCYECHGTGSALPSGDLSAFEGAGHDTTPTASGVGIACGNCHETHVSANRQLLRYSSDVLCMRCHTAGVSSPGDPDILAKLSLSDDPTSRHPLTAEDRADGSYMACQNCHNTHTTSMGNPLVDPHDPSTGGTWTGSVNSFCFECHNSTSNLPTAGETQPWVAPPLGTGGVGTVADIESVYAASIHGAASTTDGNLSLRPQFGYASGDELECSACHDPHGSANAYAFKQEITSQSGLVSVNGLSVVEAPGGGYDFRFVCSTCHALTPELHAQLASATASPPDLTEFPINCARSGCHHHAAGGVF